MSIATMAASSRADGIHFGTGEDMTSGIWRYLGVGMPTVINEPEAQWHYAEIAQRLAGGLAVWRASPERKPAQDRYDGHAYSRAIFKSLDAHKDRTGTYPADIMLLNELNLNYERGDNENDTDPERWPTLYNGLSRFLQTLRIAVAERADDRGFAPRLWYPGWAPGHGEMSAEIAAIWVPDARKYDGITFHAYGDVETITDTVEWYVRTFPGKPLLLGEWNTINLYGDYRSQDGPGRQHLMELRVQEERDIRARLLSLCMKYTQLQCCYFIYRWAGDDIHEHDIAGNRDREALWSHAVPADDYFTPIEEPEDNPVQPSNPMTAAMMGGQTLKAEALHAKRWQLHAMPSLPMPPAFNSDFGFERAWRKPENAWWGSPVTVNEDMLSTDGAGGHVPARVFTNAVVIWGPDGAIVLE